MTATPDDLSYIASRSMTETFQGWSDDQRSVYLAVHRNRWPTARQVATLLGWTQERTDTVLNSVYGYLLWDKKKADSPILLRD